VWLRGVARLTLPDNPAAHVALDALRGTRCSVDLAEDFTSVAWRKLLQNAVAGLTVLTGRRAGMFARADICELALAYLREGLEVARAEGAVLDDEVPHEIVEAFRCFPDEMGTSILADREASRPAAGVGRPQRRGSATRMDPTAYRHPSVIWWCRSWPPPATDPADAQHIQCRRTPCPVNDPCTD
jgi:ketopantoate reductase